MAQNTPEPPFMFSTRDHVFNKKVTKEWGVVIACAKARGDFEAAEAKARAELMVRATSIGGNGLVSYGISTYRTAVWNTTGVCSFGTAVTLE